MKKKIGNKGFSIVELIVVIAIMAILTGVVTASVLVYIEKAKETKALSDAKAIYSAAQYAIINASMEEPEAFSYAIKFAGNGSDERLGRFSSQSLCKYVQSLSTGVFDSAAKSSKADYYIASQIANSVPGADGTATENGLKDKGVIGDTHSTKYISDHPEQYGDVVFAMAYNSNCEIVFFQCIYNGYFMSANGGTLTAQKVSDSTKINDWPKTRADGCADW